MPLWTWLTTKLTAWRERLFPPLSLGERGERLAARYLRRKGYLIIARGQRNRYSEIDLIVVHGRTVVFVEVKTRTHQQAGHPAEAVDRDKQRRMTRAAEVYRRQHDLHEVSMRFDVVAITWPANERHPKIEHFISAFEAVE